MDALRFAHQPVHPSGPRGRHIQLAALAALVLALFGLLAFGAEHARGGELLWSKGGEIWTMHDDGSGQRLLIALAAAPGMSALRNPAVHPSGSTVMVQGDTKMNEVSRLGLCGTFPYTYSCTTWHTGFNSSGTYRWQNGALQRLTGQPSYCFDCSDGPVEPEPRADASAVSAFMHCQGFLDLGSYSCVGALQSSGGESYPSCDDLPSSPSPNPVDGLQVAYTGCRSGGNDALVVTRPGRADERVIGCDDATQSDPAWSPDGSQVVDAEGGTEPGLWVYGSGNNGCFTGSLRHAVVAPSGTSFDSPRFAGPNTIVFEASGELWSVPASCNGCPFTSARQLTTGGNNHEPAWTAAAIPAGPAGSPSPTPTPGPAATPTPTPLPAAPVVRVTGTAPQRVLRQRNAISLNLRADRSASATITGRIQVRGKDPVLRPVTKSLPAGKRVTVKIILRGKALTAVRAVLRGRRSATAVLTLTFRSEAGGVATTTKRITLKP